MLKQFSINRLLVLFVSLSFAFLAIDTLVEHWSILEEEGTAFIPIIFSALGALYALLVAIRWKERCIKNLQIFLLASVLVSFGGLYFHLAEDDDEEEEEGSTEQTEPAQPEQDKPPLAPLAFSGIATLGMLGTLRKWQAEVK